MKLEVTTYQPVGEKVQTFPPKETPKEKNNPATIQKQGENKFRDYDKSADFKSRVLNAKKTSDLGLTVYFRFLNKTRIIFIGSDCM